MYLESLNTNVVIIPINNINLTTALIFSSKLIFIFGYNTGKWSDDDDYSLITPFFGPSR